MVLGATFICGRAEPTGTLITINNNNMVFKHEHMPDELMAGNR